MRSIYKTASIFLLISIAFTYSFGQEDHAPPKPKWKLACDGNVHGATVTDMPDNPLIRSGLFSIVFDEGASDNYIFDYEEFVPGKAYTTIWRLDIEDNSKDARAVITFSDMAGNDTTITVEYYSLKLSISPEYHNFGKVKLADKPEYPFTITNESENATVELSHLQMKAGNQNFEIVGLGLPELLAPKASIDFRIRFNAVEMGMFSDSIQVGDTCVFFRKALVEARVGSPQISVTDAAFSDQTLSQTSAEDILITNTGNTDLKITGFSGLSDPAFVTNGLRPVTTQDPIILPAGKSYSFKVEFTPEDEKQYLDTIVFFSDGDGSDSLCILSGRGIKPGIMASSFDWGRKRIEAGPYTSSGKAIVIRNTGLEDVRISDLSVVSSKKDTSVFEFDRTAFLNVSIKVDDSLVVPVFFNPKEVGLHELILKYDNDVGSETQTILSGIGTFPQLTTNDAYFGETAIDDFGNPESPDTPVRFINNAWNDPSDASTDVSDSIVINGFTFMPNGNEVSDDGTNWGSEGFRFDSNVLIHSSGGISGLPMVLYPGEYLEIPAEFVARHSGSHRAVVLTENDAEIDSSSIWTGGAINRGIKVTGGNIRVMVGDQGNIPCKIENTGPTSIEVLRLELNPAPAEFSFDNPALKNGFTLAPGSTEDVDITFTPSAIGVFNLELIVENETPDNPATDKIHAEAYYHQRKTKGETTGKIFPGKPFVYTLKMESGSDIALANLRKLKLTIDFRNDFVYPDIEGTTVEVPSGNSGKFSIGQPSINVVDEDQYLSRIEMDITANSSYSFNEAVSLANVNFRSFVPYYSSDDINGPIKSWKFNIDHMIESLEYDEYVEFLPENTELEMGQVCAHDLRPIVFSKTSYSMSRVAPSPITSGSFELEFSVGLEGLTEISMVNYSGTKQIMVVSRKLQPGAYTTTINSNQLESGVYFIRMKSGPFSDVMKIIIVN